MQKAPNESDQERQVPDSPREDPSEPSQPKWPFTNDNPPEKAPLRDPDPAEKPNDDAQVATESSLEDVRIYLGVVGGADLQASGDMRGDLDLGLELLLLNADALDFALSAGYRLYVPKPGSVLEAAVSWDLHYLNVGGEFRWRFGLDWDYFLPYVGVGINVGILSWRYVNPLYAGDSTIYGDSLTGYALYAPIGMYLIRRPEICLGVSVVPQFRFFDTTTREGFTNDFFGARASMSIIGELAFSLD
jgi:hypothetical protein